MRKWLLVVALVAMPGAALAEEVYYCTDAKSAGIAWDEKNPHGGGRVTAFKKKRYVMKIISKTRRVMTPTIGDTKGITDYLTCRVRWQATVPTLLTCTDKSGLEAWAFNGSHYTRAFLNGSVLKHGYADPNILVARGTCVKY